MDPNHSNTDARHSNFIHVGRDQHNVTNNYRIYFCLFDPQQMAHHVSNSLSNNLLRLVSSPEILSPGSLVTHRSELSNAVAIVDTVVGLIDKIADLLMECTDFSNGLRDLALEFESLQKTLTLTRLVIRKYDNKPLGQVLIKTVTPEVVQCFIVLQELLGNVDGTWLGFNVTSISNLWRRIWWGRWDGDEFAMLKMRLSGSRQSLQGLLMALHSYVLLCHAPPSAEILSRSMINTKCCMDGARKRITCRLCIPSKLSCFI
jgi:hypothetical protein